MRRIVMVADSPIVPARDGGQREHLGMVNAAYEADILAALVVFAPSESSIGAHRATWPGLPIFRASRRRSVIAVLNPVMPFILGSRPYPRGLAGRIRAGGINVDGVVACSFKTIRVAHTLAEQLDVHMIARLHNIESHYFDALAQSGPRLLRIYRAWESQRIARAERVLSSGKWADGIGDISAADAKQRAVMSSQPVRWVPPFASNATVTGVQRHNREPGVVLYLGALDVGTNVQGLTWFIEEIWPQIRKGYPPASLIVAGRGPSTAFHRMLLSVPGVRVYPNPADIECFLEAASVAVNPTVVGSGVNIKLIEYITAGVPTVTTSMAAEGLLLNEADGVGVQDSPDDFAGAVLSLLNSPADAENRARLAALRLAAILDSKRNLENLLAVFPTDS